MDIVVIDEVQFGAVLVENGDRAVEARTGAGGHHIKNQRLARVGMEAEHVVVIVVHHAVDHHWQRDLLCVLEIVIRLDLSLARQRPHVEHTDMRAARGAQPVVVQSDGNLGPYGNPRFHRKKIGGE